MKQTLLLILTILAHTGFTQSSNYNTAYDEQNPVLSPDGQTLYFTRANHPDNVNGYQDPGDIWVSYRQPDNSWAEAIHAGNVINSRGWNGVIGFDSTGTVMYLHHHYFNQGKPRSQGVSYTKKVGKEWVEPVNVSIPYFRNVSPHQSGWINEDEDILLLSFDGFYSRGNEDLYVVLRNADGTWREPVNLGKVINTKFQEFSPYYSTEDSTLYFSGNGRDESTEVYFSKRQDYTWTNWSEPQLLGDTINTDGREIGFVNYPELNLAALSSTQNSDGYGDIKIHVYGTLPEKEDQEIKLFVVDANTQERLNANIEITGVGSKDNYQVGPGGIDLSDYASGDYKISAISNGYLMQDVEVNTREAVAPIIIRLQPLKEGARVVLDEVLFKLSSDELIASSYAELNQVVRLMRENPDLRIRLEGHTDTKGSAKANLKLSKLRVEAVKDYLVNKGISKRRIKGKGFGGKYPLFTDDENREKNRRVEFVILK